METKHTCRIGHVSQQKFVQCNSWTDRHLAQDNWLDVTRLHIYTFQKNLGTIAPCESAHVSKEISYTARENKENCHNKCLAVLHVAIWKRRTKRFVWWERETIHFLKCDTCPGKVRTVPIASVWTQVNGFVHYDTCTYPQVSQETLVSAKGSNMNTCVLKIHAACFLSI